MLIPVILSGGAGTRLWPASRELNPKPFLKPDGQWSLLQQTFLRAKALPDVSELITVTHREFYFRTADEYREINDTGLSTHYILEPFGRNTAPAIALAALEARRLGHLEAHLLILPADHVIHAPEAFIKAVAEAVTLSTQDHLVCFGIQPDQPETGFGYLDVAGSKVRRFVEKPDLATAQAYLDAGHYLWNSGMFCFKVRTVLDELARHAPDVLEAAERAFTLAKRLEGAGREQIELTEDVFGAAPDISIDYALLEKSSSVAVVPCDLGWSDVGNWDAMGTLHAPDTQGNTVSGRAMLHDAMGCHVESQERLAALVGVRDLVVVDTPDALLVADRRRAQDVKHIVARLKAEGGELYKLHKTVHRPWGTYTVLEDKPVYKIKCVVVHPGRSLSLQLHHHRSEHWVVVEGVAKVTNGDRELTLLPSQSTYIPAETQHRLENIGVVDLVLIEVQTGTYLGEDDIVRFEDRYGRV